MMHAAQNLAGIFLIAVFFATVFLYLVFTQRLKKLKSHTIESLYCNWLSGKHPHAYECPHEWNTEVAWSREGFYAGVEETLRYLERRL
jgi:hypothetical protein